MSRLDGTYGPLIHKKDNGNTLVCESGSQLIIRGSIAGPTRGVNYYVDPQNGSDSTGDGLSWATAFASMTPLDSLLTHGDTIYLSGVLKQLWTAPAKNDITIVGVGTQPRQATSDGVANGGGATWMNPATTATPLILLGNSSADVLYQGWSFYNIFFSQAGAAACVKLHRKLTGADPSHAKFFGCKFTGVGNGIESVECSFLNVEDCEFFNFTTTAKGGIQSIAGDGVALPLQWNIRRNRFWNNVRHLVGALSSAVIVDNEFSWKGSSITTTIQVDLTGGKNNIIMGNRFQVAHAATGSGAMFGTVGTDDAWYNTYSAGPTNGKPAT